MSHRRREIGSAGWARSALCALIGIFYFLPVLWIILTAFKSPRDVLTLELWFTPTLDNFSAVFHRAFYQGGEVLDTQFDLFFFNSVFIAGTSVGLTLILGTAAAYAADLVGALHHQDLTTAEAKVLSAEQAKDRIDSWRRSGHRIGFTNGCFDLLHPGHVSLLKQAKKACGRLVVGLNSDGSVEKLKGDGRPVQSEAARAAMLASLETVDMVVIFTERTPLTLIKALKPDVLVKGADYDLKKVVGADVVKRYGGKVLLAKIVPGHSTSATIARIAK